jgi:MFS superfamily sulfate permease-like transporter
MRRTIKYYRIIWLRHDLPAGLSVFLVALPLCLGIALASGAPLYAGLLSGIIGGLVVTLISGSQLAVSGPAAGLTTLVAASIISLGDYNIFLLTVMVAGLFQLTLGLLRLGAIANYFPSSVIKGMLAAIGIILILKQIPLALGYDKPDFWRASLLHTFSSDNFLEKVNNFNHETTRGAILITIISLIILILLQQPFAKKFKVIPAPLLVVVIGIITNFIFTNVSPDFSLKQTQLVNIPSNIFASITFPTSPNFFQQQKFGKTDLLSDFLQLWKRCFALRQLTS